MKQKTRVLVVDDSAFARFAISNKLQAAPDIKVVDFARDGAEALEKVMARKPDVVTLDVEMPRMDGLTALKRIMTVCPTPVVMISTLTGNGTQATIRALELGAVDFFLKPSLTRPAGADGTGDDLITKLKIAARVKVSQLGKIASPKLVRSKPERSVESRLASSREVVVIGSSTGGPRALYQVIPALPADIPAAILVVQHMPPGFTKSMADRLNELSEITVKEAEAGDMLRHGEAFVAPGGYHMMVKKDRFVGLNQAPPVCGVRPSVDVTMESVALVFGASTTGIVLTGMGCDGTNGTSLIKAAGGKVIEDESSCSVYGMPKSVADAGNADRIVPLPGIASELVRMLNNKVRFNRS